jgi:hypothetical protein
MVAAFGYNGLSSTAHCRNHMCITCSGDAALCAAPRRSLNERVAIKRAAGLLPVPKTPS